jgi:two-component system, OmpR family, sensor histidine kinase KdpD
MTEEITIRVTRRHRTQIETVVAVPFLVSLGGVALATALGAAFGPFVDLAVIPLLYVTAVLITAAAFGLIPSLLASFTSVLAWDFFFLPPLYSLRIARPEDILGLLFFSFVAVTTSGLASRLREQMLVARNREKTMVDLYAFSRSLTGIATREELLETTAEQVGSMLRLAVVVLIEDNERASAARQTSRQCATR